MKPSAERALNWIASSITSDGGLAAYRSHNYLSPSYPEVTGYTIPTLLAYGETALARRLADYLLSIQNTDGSFDILDRSGPAVFDTVACMEGLLSIGELTAAAAASKWATDNLARMVRIGYSIPIYHARSAALLNLPLTYWSDWRNTHWDRPLRTHYIAYCMEGLGEQPPIVTLLYHEYYSRDWIRHSTGHSFALGASSQMACLADDPAPLVYAISAYQWNDGGIPLTVGDPECWSWTLKYFLDACLKAKD
uniref:Squalene cyclase C-terminal domain-containing protein n=1 Tax=viral metagenome TaxID=1070528 RepID=A0A6M3INJ8_9ZZZZ